MPFLTLLSDYGYSDPYLIQLKSMLWRLNPQAQIIDIAHGVEKYNLGDAAFVLSKSIHSFPKETIHVVLVSSAVNFNGRYLLAKLFDQWVLCADNGLLSLLSKEPPSMLFHIEPETKAAYGSDVLAPVAAKLSSGMTPENFGNPTDTYQKLNLPEVRVEENKLTGHVIYIDSYGNVVTNITREHCAPFLAQHQVDIQFKSERLTKISNDYFGLEGGETIALFNQFGHLEIAIIDGHASRLLGMTYMSQVDLQFY